MNYSFPISEGAYQARLILVKLLTHEMVCFRQELCLNGTGPEREASIRTKGNHGLLFPQELIEQTSSLEVVHYLHISQPDNSGFDLAVRVKLPPTD